jgi:hypothetical protein
MRKTLGILAAVLLALSIFSAVLGLGGDRCRSDWQRKPIQWP